MILPVFIHDGEQNIPIGSMSGVDRLGWRHGLLDSVAEARSYGVNSVVLFPKVTLAHSPLCCFDIAYDTSPGSHVPVYVGVDAVMCCVDSRGAEDPNSRGGIQCRWSSTEEHPAPERPLP